MNNFVVVIISVVAYLIGAIPTGYLIARLKGVKDIREHGSGNIGATNVSRMLGWHYFVIIFLLDAGKAFTFIYVIKSHFSVEYLYFFAALFLLGNTRSLFLKGSGGKGVATLFGLITALNMIVVMVLLGVWCCSMLVIKTVGIASVISVLSLPVYALLVKNYMFFIFACIVSGWIVWLHQSNLFLYWEGCCRK